ncbi:hypothetical protein ACFYXF_47470 [Streptomyces sp. NPDC002680]|uniref:hypothetical protein n=1 Tax=Streptomyces sp. NPDC002680 TaxID=3364659 RepID=UPI0036CB4E00
MTEEKRISATAIGVIDFPALPAGTETTLIPVAADDDAGSRGVLYARGGERTVVITAHPRGDMTRHYAAPAVLEAGYAFYVHSPRSLNNDVDIEHERLLLDLAAGLKHLKDERGYEKIVLLGNSGGGSLLTFYQQQATTPSPGRLTDTASGDPLDLNAVEMPKADGVVLLAAHPGQGSFMLTSIDPSVIDEDDPLLVDPELDMYNPANGYRPLPEGSKYSADFLEPYRAAQHARVARLDARAHALIAEQNRYKQQMQEPGFADLPLEEQHYITRRALVGQYMVVHRTEADPAFTDLSLHAWKSTRKPGSILGARPDQVNYAASGFGRLVTPRAWLSTWSGLSTRARLAENLKSVHEPLLMINYTADSLCFPDDNKAQFDATPAEDKTMDFVDADHFTTDLAKRAEALQLVVDWLAPRFPAASNA